MKPSPGSAEQRWWFRHAWITVTACGLLGALIFFAVVRSMMSDEPLGGSWFSAYGAPLPGVGLISFPHVVGSGLWHRNEAAGHGTCRHDAERPSSDC